MKKIISLLFCMVLVGCESAPKPAPFPENDGVALNSFAPQGVWTKTIIKSNRLESIKDWYFLQHATSIELKGDYNVVSNYKNYLIENGVSGDIKLVSKMFLTGQTIVITAKGGKNEIKK
ncbi:TPA: hypothetical protein U2I61_004266 [Providencia rettgeri]|nr:hypothetical protein [Providencia rettgeri]HEM7189728.1 hypothetical protein [Providencia rettgeri]